MRILVLIIGIIIIGLIVWWFFGKHEAESAAATMAGATQTVDVTVKGGYLPEVVELKQGVPATLNFTRTDPSTCLDHVVFPDFGINRELPKGETESITIDTSKPGEYGWACGMDMFHGKLIIK